MKQHFLQSTTWEQYEKTTGHQTFRLTGDGFEVMAVLKSTPIGKYLFCPYGPTIYTKDGLPASLNALRDLAREQQAFFVRIEPTVPLASADEDRSPLAFSVANFQELHLCKSHDIDPAHTWQLSLEADTETLFKDMETSKGRAWRNAAKRHLSIRQSTNPDDVAILSRLLQQIGEQDNFIPQSEQHLRDQITAGFATLYIAEQSAPDSETTPVAAALFYDYDGLRFYAHAAADNNYRKIAPGTVIIVQAILDAKAAGSKIFDFWGITTSTDPKHPWYGFTTYKKSFSGYQVDYAGTWDLPLNRFKYSLYGLIRKLNRSLRKIHH